MSIRELLESLPFVATRRLNGRDGFFTAGRMFALLSETALLLRMPVPTTEALLEADRVQSPAGPNPRLAPFRQHPRHRRDGERRAPLGPVVHQQVGGNP